MPTNNLLVAAVMPKKKKASKPKIHTPKARVKAAKPAVKMPKARSKKAKMYAK